MVYVTVNGETIETISEHPFYTKNDKWVAAYNLKVGDELRQADGDYHAVESVRVERRSQVMYNLTVAEAHTFFVGNGQWLVHNECEPISIYRGIGRDRPEDLAILKETGYVMSDSASNAYNLSRLRGASIEEAISEARHISETMQNAQIKFWGTMDEYVQAHTFADEALYMDGRMRTLISFTTDRDVAITFATRTESRGTIVTTTVMDTPRIFRPIEGGIINGKPELEVLIKHMIKVRP